MAEPRRLLAAGAVLAAGLLAVASTGGPSWRAWLAAATLAMSLPAGAIGWILVMRLAVGEWTGPLAEACAAMAGRAPFASILFVPILLDPGALYPWVGQHQASVFRAIYLSFPFFALRTVAWLVALSLAGVAIAAGRPVSKPLACIGIIAFVLCETALVTDWLASLDASFNSSGFGLYVMAIQFASALALAILAGRPEETHRASALLLTMMLCWGYFAFMQYFILWSGNLPAGMDWYRARQSGIWPWLMVLISAFRLPAVVLLLFRAVRHGRRWMAGLAAAVLFGSAAEFAWLAMPGAGGGPVQGALYAFLAAAAMALIWPPHAAIPDEGGAA